MAVVKDFRELRCWQAARVLTKDVYALTKGGEFARDYGLKDQVQRAAVSIGSNIAEGFERDNNAELSRFIGYAKGSAGEVISQLYTAFDVGYITESQLQKLVAQLKEIGGMLSKVRSSVRAKEMKGLAYKPIPALQ